MSADERLVSAAREILQRASEPVTLGPRHDDEAYVLIPARCLTWLSDAMTADEKAPGSYVVIDPRMKSGAPTLRGHRLDAEMIAERYWDLGEHLDSEILDAYEISRADVLACCFYVASFGARTWRTRWKAWLDASWAATGSGEDDGPMRGWWSEGWADVSLPPTAAQQTEPRP